MKYKEFLILFKFVIHVLVLRRIASNLVQKIPLVLVSAITKKNSLIVTFYQCSWHYEL